MNEIRRRSLAQRARVCKDNRKEYDNEKRAKELSARGFNQEAIAGMMEIKEHEVVKLVKHQTKAIIRDGEL